MGWELSASAAPCAQVSSAAQTALETLSGVNSALYPAISSYPSTGFRNGQANIFPSLPSLNKVSSYTLDTMANPAQNMRHHGKMYPLLEWKRWHRRSMKKVSGIQVAGIPWSLFTAMAYSNTASNGCTCQESTPHHIQLFRHSLFSSSLVRPKTAFTFDVLDHFYMDSMECKTAAFSFLQKLSTAHK